jgi:hypothetical protein
MPWGDRTGPMGLGPMTGRAAGYCAGYGVPGYANPVWGRGRGGGRGRGWGRGYGMGGPGWGRGRWGGAWGWYSPPFPPYPVAYPQGAPDVGQDVESLREQASYLEEALESVRKRLSELEASGDE